MRHILMTLFIVVVLTAISFVRNANDAFFSMNPSLLRLVILATALPPLMAAFTWPPLGVLVTTIVVLLLTLVALPLSQRWADLGPTVGVLLVADVLAVILAVGRKWAIRRAEERAGLAEIRQALADAHDLVAFAGVVAWSGRRVMGPGTLQLWVLDRESEELRLVRGGNHFGTRYGPDAESLRTSPDRMPLDAPDPRAQAVHLSQPAEGFMGDALDRDAGTPLDPRLRRGDAVYVFGVGGSSSVLRALSAARFQLQREQNAVLAVPVQWRGQTVGALAYERSARTSERFSSDDRSRLAAVAILCAEKIDRSQPHEPAET